MDYKAMVRNLRTEAWGQKERFSREILATELNEAADAIETLLAERDAAVEDLRGLCWCCANGKLWEKAGPLSNMTSCRHMKERGVIACSGRAYKCQYWQWRGPQKEGGA